VNPRKTPNRISRPDLFKLVNWLGNQVARYAEGPVVAARECAAIRAELGVVVVPEQLVSICRDAGIPVTVKRRRANKGPSADTSRTLCRAVVRLYERLGEPMPAGLDALFKSYLGTKPAPQEPPPHPHPTNATEGPGDDTPSRLNVPAPHRNGDGDDLPF
jgi:hypothetical protein